MDIIITYEELVGGKVDGEFKDEGLINEISPHRVDYYRNSLEKIHKKNNELREVLLNN